MTGKVAFIVGRFQNVDLHSGYIYLFKKALLFPDVTHLVIVMGSSPVPATRKNPFTYGERLVMFKDSLLSTNPDIYSRIIGFIEQKDQNEDPVWSKNLDAAISNFMESHLNLDKLSAETGVGYPSGMGETPILVCSRDSFKSHYSGKYEVVEIEPNHESQSSTEQREVLAKQMTYFNRSYLMGKLNAIYSKFPTVYPTVDVAIINDKTQEILLGRKHAETKWRFPGGFTDPTDENFEAAAKREAFEEVGPIELGDWQYICSMRVNDWRYRSEVDKIMTTFFRCSYLFGIPQASDDLAEVKWFKLSEITEYDVFPGHLELLKKLRAFEEQHNTVNRIKENDPDDLFEGL